MRFVILSDTHERHREIAVPNGEVLIHTGDFTINGDIDKVKDFMRWFEEQPHVHKIFIAGNHDRSFELQNEYVRKLINDLMPSCTYLQDSITSVKGLRIYGSPWTPLYMTDYWKFHKRRGEPMAEIWRQIPRDVDILLTHGPAFGTLDMTQRGDRAGDEELAKRLEELPQLKLHAFGHIHEGFGMKEQTLLPVREAYSLPPFISVNAALCDITYKVIRQPVVVDL